MAEKYRCMKVEFLLDEREVKALEELLEEYQNIEMEDHSKPFKDWTIEKVFQAVMEPGSQKCISDKLQESQLRMNMIDEHSYLSVDNFKTMEEWREEWERKN